MTINDILNSLFTDSQKLQIITWLLNGGEVKTLSPTLDISIGNKKYKVQTAETDEEREIGLSKVTELAEDCGMLFIYEELQPIVYYTMEDTSLDLDIIFIDETGEVISVHSKKNHDPRPVSERDVLFVLEVNIHSGIKPGEMLEGLEEAEDPDDDILTEEDKEIAKNSRMLVLNENGDVQMKLLGGERIISRKETVLLLKLAIKAFKTDDLKAYKQVGCKIFKILNLQDSRLPEYVNKD